MESDSRMDLFFTRRLLHIFGVVSVTFGAIAFVSGLSFISCGLQITSGGIWLALTRSEETFEAAREMAKGSNMCFRRYRVTGGNRVCGCGLDTIFSLNIAGIVFAPLEIIFPVLMLLNRSRLYLQLYWPLILVGHSIISMVANICLFALSMAFISTLGTKDDDENVPLVVDSEYNIAPKKAHSYGGFTSTTNGPASGPSDGGSAEAVGEVAYSRPPPVFMRAA